MLKAVYSAPRLSRLYLHKILCQCCHFKGQWIKACCVYYSSGEEEKCPPTSELLAQVDDGEEKLKDRKVNINFCNCASEFSFSLLLKETKNDAACISNLGVLKIETLLNLSQQTCVFSINYNQVKKWSPFPGSFPGIIINQNRFWLVGMIEVWLRHSGWLKIHIAFTFHWSAIFSRQPHPWGICEDLTPAWVLFSGG